MKLKNEIRTITYENEIGNNPWVKIHHVIFANFPTSAIMIKFQMYHATACLTTDKFQSKRDSIRNTLQYRKEDIHINFKNVSYLLYLNIFLHEIKIKICKIYIAFPFYIANVQCCIGEFYMA